jgi:hypothetical protein
LVIRSVGIVTDPDVFAAPFARAAVDVTSGHTRTQAVEDRTVKLRDWVRRRSGRRREPFRVGFDVDGVVADLETRLATHPEARPEHRVENFWESLAECEPGGVARLAAVADARQWEVVFLTRRPPTPGATSQRQTQQWLERVGYPLPSVCVVSGSRGLVARALSLDAVVDDQWDACLDVLADSDARPVLLWRPRPCPIESRARQLGISVVATLDECVTALLAEEMARPGISR